MRTVLVRHPPPLIEAGICYGRTDLPLHPETLDGLADYAASIDGSGMIWSSPARRCRDLAETVGDILSLPVAIDPRLLELDFGAWEGLAWDAVPRRALDTWAADPLAFRPPRGESGSELIERVRAFHADILLKAQDCAVVSHGGPLKVLTALLRDAAVDLLAAPQPIGSTIAIETAGSKI